MSNFIMPSLGADMTEGLLVAWRVQPGEQVRRGDIVAEVETQKGLFEIEAFDEGVINRCCLNRDRRRSLSELF